MLLVLMVNILYSHYTFDIILQQNILSKRFKKSEFWLKVKIGEGASKRSALACRFSTWPDSHRRKIYCRVHFRWRVPSAWVFITLGYNHVSFVCTDWISNGERKDASKGNRRFGKTVTKITDYFVTSRGSDCEMEGTTLFKII